jgi:hypothetical protein
MSKKTLKRGVGGSTDRFIKMPHFMLKSPAYRTMPDSAKALLTEVWLRYNGVNNGEISFSCREATTFLGWSHATAARMFDVLIERGFLVVVRESTFDRKKIARTWRITVEPYHSEPETKDFMRWQPPATVALAKNHFLVSPVRHDSRTRETPPVESAATVSPVRLSAPFWPAPQSHQCDTYSIPCRPAPAPHPIRRGWKPSGFTRQRAREDLGMRHGETHDLTRSFRDHHLNINDESADWNQVWLDFVRLRVTERRQREEK